jgi:HEPN domain-containing protein
MKHNREIVKEWIEKAEQDFNFALASLEFDDFFAQICFHFQQSAEKYLKAFIIAYDLEFRPVHNLIELLEICRQKEPKIKEIEEACRYLNPFYVDTRYPVHWPVEYNKDTAIKAKMSVQEIRIWVKKQLEI